MKIGGFQKFSLIDYPGKTAAVIFTQGCNFRCPYCHNPELVYPELFRETCSQKEIFDFLERRKDKLDGVVVTGGEPCLQKDLLDFLSRLKEKGFLVKLDTNGSRPDVLQQVLGKGFADFIAMDIKAPLPKYEALAGTPVSLDAIQESVRILKKASFPIQFRTTFDKKLLNDSDIDEIRVFLGEGFSFDIQECLDTKEKTATAS